MVRKFEIPKDLEGFAPPNTCYQTSLKIIIINLNLINFA